MNFYTLEYDCNTPVTQQINVPTNSDYKVGMKVKRNGEVQSIKPSEFTITSGDETTIPVDSEKTNGYVTFTQASNDDASYRQLGVHIEHGYIWNDEYTVKGQFGSTKPDPNPSIVAITAGDLGLAGVEIHASDYERISSRYWRKNTPPPEDLNEWDAVDLWTGQATQILKLALAPTASVKYRSVYHPLIDYTISEIDYAVPELIGFTFKAGEYYFVESDLSGAWYIISNITQTKIFEADEIMLYTSGLRYTANYYWGRNISMAFGTPFSADFKLNLNIHKSQKGDINIVGRASTVNFAGTDGQGNPFSYDIITK